MKTWWVVWQNRRRAVGDLLGQLAAQSASTQALPSHEKGLSLPLNKLNTRRIRLASRLLAGFRDPLWESALLAVALRRQGWAASLVVGYEPVPAATGRRLVPWVEVDGIPVARSAPPAAYCPVLVRYPAAADSGPATGSPGRIVGAGP